MIPFVRPEQLGEIDDLLHHVRLHTLRMRDQRFQQALLPQAEAR